MPLFAVLGEQDVVFRLRKCHLNLWALPGILRTHFYCDVGLKVSVGEGKPLSRVRILLPFGTREDGLTDLSDLIREPNVSRLIFGEPVQVTDNGVLTYRDETLRVRSISAADKPTNSGRGRTAESLWTLKVQPAASIGSDYYLRARFEISDLSATWLWKRGLVLKRIGANVDFRVCDVRETSTTLGSEEGSILPIENLYVFVVAPLSLQAQSFSPPLRYTRVLEGRAWARYLESAVTPRPSTKLVVYYWRAAQPTIPQGTLPGFEVGGDGHLSTNPLNPFRAFLDLSREYGPTTLLNHVITLVLVILGVSTAGRVIGAAAFGAGLLLKLLAAIWAAIVTLGLAVLVLSVFGWIRKAIGWADRTSRRLDRRLSRLWGA